MTRAFLLCCAVLTATPATAEVVASGVHGFEVRQIVQVVIPQPAAYDAFTQVPRWWNPEHSYSGDAANLSLALTPGGCFCEKLPGGGGVEHLRLSHVAPGERLVLTGALGPLLYEAVAGVMDVKVERIAGGARVTLNYRAAGFANGGAAKLAPLVDQVLGDQMARYRKFAATLPRTR